MALSYPQQQELSPKWTLDVQQEIYASLIAAYGLLFLSTRNGRIYILRESDGQKVIEFTLGDGQPIILTPALSEEEKILYVMSQSTLVAFSLFSLANSKVDAGDFSTPLWSFRPAGNNEIFSTHVVAANGKIVVCSRGVEDHASKVYILDHKKRDEVKSVKVNGEVSTPVFDSQQSIIIVATHAGEALAIHGETGQILFNNAQNKIEGGIKTEIPPAIFLNKIWLFNSEGKLFYSTYEGAFNFSRVGAVVNKLVNAFSISPYGITIADGVGIERYSLYGTRAFVNRELGAVVASPVNTDRLILAATYDGNLYILSNDNPSLARKAVISFRHEIHAMPAVTEHSILVASSEGKVACFSFE